MPTDRDLELAQALAQAARAGGVVELLQEELRLHGDEPDDHVCSECQHRSESVYSELLEALEAKKRQARRKPRRRR